eukprot:m.467528 g.467528  ORF g.467528 m.467528 type:complete len:81 (-) comp26446_c0_seq1:134-376(-)
MLWKTKAIPPYQGWCPGPSGYCLRPGVAEEVASTTRDRNRRDENTPSQVMSLKHKSNAQETWNIFYRVETPSNRIAVWQS